MCYGLGSYQLAMGRWMPWPLLAVRILSEGLGLVPPYSTQGCCRGYEVGEGWCDKEFGIYAMSFGSRGKSSVAE